MTKDRFCDFHIVKKGFEYRVSGWDLVEKESFEMTLSISELIEYIGDISYEGDKKKAESFVYNLDIFDIKDCMINLFKYKMS